MMSLLICKIIIAYLYRGFNDDSSPPGFFSRVSTLFMAGMSQRDRFLDSFK